jgi:hypothetical protein
MVIVVVVVHMLLSHATLVQLHAELVPVVVVPCVVGTCVLNTLGEFLLWVLLGHVIIFHVVGRVLQGILLRY